MRNSPWRFYVSLSPEQTRVLNILAWHPATLEDLFWNVYGRGPTPHSHERSLLAGLRRTLGALESRHKIKRCTMRKKGPGGVPKAPEQAFYLVKR